MPRDLVAALHGAIREALRRHRADCERRYTADTPPTDRWIDDGAREAAVAAVAILNDLGFEVIHPDDLLTAVSNG